MRRSSTEPNVPKVRILGGFTSSDKKPKETRISKNESIGHRIKQAASFGGHTSESESSVRVDDDSLNQISNKKDTEVIKVDQNVLNDDSVDGSEIDETSDNFRRAIREPSQSAAPLMAVVRPKMIDASTEIVDLHPNDHGPLVEVSMAELRRLQNKRTDLARARVAASKTLELLQNACRETASLLAQHQGSKGSTSSSHLNVSAAAIGSTEACITTLLSYIRSAMRRHARTVADDAILQEELKNTREEIEHERTHVRHRIRDLESKVKLGMNPRSPISYIHPA